MWSTYSALADLPLSPASPTFAKIDEPVSTYCKLRSRVYVRFEGFFSVVVHSVGFDKVVMLSIQC